MVAVVISILWSWVKYFLVSAYDFRNGPPSFRFSFMGYYVTLVGLVDEIKAHLLHFLHHAVAQQIVCDYVPELVI